MSVFRNQKPLAIKELLTRRSDRLCLLHQRAVELAQLQQLLRQNLPTPLRDHLLVAACDPHTLVLITDGAAWAARLRFQIPRLRTLARKKCGLPGLDTIRIRVTAPEARPKPVSRKFMLSSSSAELLRQSAAVAGDEALSASLLRLSKHC